MKRWCCAFGLILLAACDSGGADPATTVTTIAVAPPTTVPPPTALATTTVPPATAAPTTAPPTTVPPTPAEIAQTEIRATLDAMYADLDRCWSAPDDCDIDALLSGYFLPAESVPRDAYRKIWERLNANGQRKVVDGRFERTFPWITSDVDGVAGSSYMCEINNSFDIANDEPNTSESSPPLNLRATYFRVYFEWARQPDNSWRITHSEGGIGRSPDSMELENLSSLTDEELAQCF